MFRYYMKLDAKRVELVQLMHKFASKFFAKNALDPPHWNQTHVLEHYYTEVGAKWVELVQLMKKIVPQNRIRVFRNERTRSTPFETKLMDRCVLYCLGAFWIVSLQHETRCEIG